ncbi:MAG: DUF4405 domain-containing protein [Armatimonadota bacterium]|nr:DUF4405 domain-containing protein [bacterium]
MRKTVSLITTVSFAATAITGLMMMFAHVRVVTPLHELMGLVFAIVAMFHVVLNAKCLGDYIKQKPVMAAALLVLTLAITAFLIVAGPRHEGPRHGPPSAQESENFERD